MDYRQKRSTIIKYYFKRERIGKKYVWRKKVHRNNNLSKFEKLPYDILTYMSQFLNIIDITVFPTLSQSLHDDFKLNYFKNSQAELYLRFGYGYSILDSLFLFSKMNIHKDDTLMEKCLNNSKLLNEFLIIIDQVIKHLIKEKKFTEDKIILFVKFMLELNYRTKKRNEKYIITSNLINIIVTLGPFLERHLNFLSTIFHKCLEFLDAGTRTDNERQRQIGTNGIINLIQNSKSHIILENALFREITNHISELYVILPSKELEFITNFYLEIKKRREKDNNEFRQRLLYFLELGTNF
jgi:hypothetical protein